MLKIDKGDLGRARWVAMYSVVPSGFGVLGMEWDGMEDRMKVETPPP